MNHSIPKENNVIHNEDNANRRCTYYSPEGEKHFTEEMYSTYGLSGTCNDKGKKYLIIYAVNSLPAANPTLDQWLRHAQMQVADCLTKRLKLDLLSPDPDYQEHQSFMVSQEAKKLILFIRSSDLYVETYPGMGLPSYLMILSRDLFIKDTTLISNLSPMEPVKYASILLAARLKIAADIREGLTPSFPSDGSSHEWQRKASSSVKQSRKQRRKRTKAARKKNSRKNKCQDIPAESPTGGSLAGDRPLLLKAILAAGHSG
ncbi:hypothetical protein HER14_04660 [Acidithiobacillus thiooxidans]|uniref:hypothetical protein n=1 Tax=Acidithiobacillus thiooxidans TaxID=930 RepID=UPI001C071BE0|nr:hypothetical protein [Acidithiobacillus thiooxidans]MBU2750246.1 hypothetical protein [Acidithiobacillus thiooxidans]